ncbi:MAG: glycosyltransferase family 1 protein [Nitrospinota bacterium]|nr:MAG: glycosyltransferase family 1 protein [Nitrospinota bacterium]
MKIALIRKAFRLHGGAERFTSRFLQELQHQGHAVHLFAHRWSLPSGTSCTLHPVPLLKGLSVLQVLSFALATAWLVRRETFDLVFSFERTLVQDVYRAGDGCHRQWLRQRRRYYPFLQVVGDRWNPLHRVILAIERRLYAPDGTCQIIANSYQVKEEIMRHYATPAGRIAVVYNGIDLETFHPRLRARWREEGRQRYGIPEETLVLLFVGSGFQRKGLTYLLSALKRLEQQVSCPLLLLVVGKGNPKPYQRQVAQEGIRSPVLFPGVQAEIERYYALADLFVLPTLYDPFSNATLEAMASGLPVITTAWNGAAEILGAWRERLVVSEPAATEVLAQKIIDVLPEREAVGAALRSLAEAYPLQACVEEMLRVASNTAGS